VGASAGPVAEFVEVWTLSGRPRSQRAAPVPERRTGLRAQRRSLSSSKGVEVVRVPFDRLRGRVVRFRRVAPFPLGSADLCVVVSGP
jgi:hypothetical protein